jgi:hypothetical protein
MTDLHDALEQRAARGELRGAEAVFQAASGSAEPPDWPRRVAVLTAAAVVLALVAAAVIALRTTDPEGQAPIDDGPSGPNVEVERFGPAVSVDGPVFGAETGTTLIASGGGNGIVTLDMDTGNVMAASGAVPTSDAQPGNPDVLPVEDRLVFVTADSLASVPADLSSDPTLMPGLPNGRTTAGSNDAYDFIPAGDSDRFWFQSGPTADQPNREFLAEERSVAGEVTSPTIALGRTDAKVVGATSDRVLVEVNGANEVRDRASQQVLDTLPGTVLATRGERVVLAENCEDCPLYVMDLDSGAEREVQPSEAIDGAGQAALSPDGGLLAFIELEVTGSAGEVTGSSLAVVDLESGETSVATAPGFEAFYGIGPVWSPDGSWVFVGSGEPGEGGIFGYHVGDESGSIVNVQGFVPWSLAAIDRADGPQANEIEPCEGQITTSAPCHAQVTTAASSGAAETPTTPSAINVVVANGSGVAGVASLVSNRLTELGYTPLPPTNTTVDTSATPLDTVYFSTNPNTTAQARVVAEDLGLSEAAVLPYPGVEAAPVDMGLAQVLVVLGSAPGQLASNTSVNSTTTLPSARTYSVNPESDLRDGQTVEVRGEGYGDDQGVQAIQCTYDDHACDQATAVGWSTPGGAFDEQFTVRRFLTTPTGEIDCREVQCALFVGAVGDPGSPGSSFLDFA